MNVSRKTLAVRPLWLDLTLVVIIKVALIFCLWKVFFSNPVAEHMVVPDPLIEQRFGPSRSSETAPQAHFYYHSQGAHHAS